MGNEGKNNMPLKILMPVVVLCSLVVIWLLKNPLGEADSTVDIPAEITLSASSGPVGTGETVGTSPKNDEDDKTKELAFFEQTESNPDFDLVTTEKIDLEQLKTYGLPILLEFGSESCPPCKQMAPIIEELNKELRGKAIVKYADVWEYPEIGEDYPLSVIPTQVFIDAEGNPYNPPDPDALAMKLYSLRTTGEHVFTTHEGIISKEDLLSVLTEMGMEE